MNPDRMNPGPMNLVDIGANLTHDSFDADRDQVIEDALQAGVARMVLTGATEQGSKDALELARLWPDVMTATAGVHPHHSSEYTDSVHDTLRELQEHPEVVAVGECGLDYFRNFSPADAQRHAFSRQLELAVDNQLPVFLHQRDAHHDFMEILVPAMSKITRAVAHCFTGTEDELRAYIDLDLYVGITGWICDERRGAHLQEIVGLIPPDRLLIETDAPYLLPRTLRPKPKSRRNEPKYLPEVLRVIAESTEKDPGALAKQTTQNAMQFFGLQ
jgi:TatD DNase family protein